MTPSPTRRSHLKTYAAAGIATGLGGLGGFLALSGGDRMPDTTFVTIGGERIPSRSLEGRVVLVNFWATSCIACVQEMPMLVETYQKYADQGYSTVAVAMRYDPPNFVVNFAQTRQLPFTVALDLDGHNALSFGDVTLTPTTFLVDRKGRIVRRYVGEPPVASLHAEIERALQA